MRYVSDLDTPLLRLAPDDYFTLRDAAQGVAVFGATGSGKTSASGKALASAYLRAGMSGLVLCAKPEEIELFKRYARENGRARDLVLFGDGGSHSFNFIDYEMQAQGPRGLGSVTECVMRILEAEKVVMPHATGATEPIWERTPRQLLNNTLPILYAAYGRVQLDELYRFVTSAPKKAGGMQDAEWQAKSFMFASLVRATDHPQMPIDAAEGDKIMSYWEGEYAELAPETRGSVLITLSSAIDRFLRGRLRDHFCRGTTLTPEAALRDGKIIVMAMPALSWNEDGLIGQHVFKYMWQRAVLRRNAMAKPYRERPCFLWADEAQYFIASSDTDYQAACRSSLGCTVYLTQNMPSYVAALSGDAAEAKARKLLGNFATKILHANADPETNDWAARTIGRALVVRRNFSQGRSISRSRGMNENEGTSANSSNSNNANYGRESNFSSQSGSSYGRNAGRGRNIGTSDSDSENEGGTETMDHMIEPRVFAQELRTGGPQNGREVDAIWFQTGRRFRDSGSAVLYTTFRQ